MQLSMQLKYTIRIRSFENYRNELGEVLSARGICVTITLNLILNSKYKCNKRLSNYKRVTRMPEISCIN